ncbi:MAG: hypothetical protein N3H31_01965 [Candidatus Nezhaarchaeota archaeon]|nr:hypothetical protein [Candidatus Nezhaarchaeota archaeon]
MTSLLPLMSTSVTSPLLKSYPLLLVSSCMMREYPSIVEEQSVRKVGLHVCLQETHVDRVGLKIATIIFKAQPVSLTVLTMNGSPHCIQLHFAVELAKQLTAYNGPIEHLVVEKGVLLRVSSEAVQVARHLASVERLLKERAHTVTSLSK